MLKKSYRIKGNEDEMLLGRGVSKKSRVKTKKALSLKTNCNKKLNFFTNKSNYKLGIYELELKPNKYLEFDEEEEMDDYLSKEEGFDDYWLERLNKDNGYLEKGSRVYMAFCNEG